VRCLIIFLSFSPLFFFPHREIIGGICEELMSPELPLFEPVPNASTKLADNQDAFVPRAKPSRVQLKAFAFFGMFLGLIMRTRNYVELRFPPIFWKALGLSTITLGDCFAIDAKFKQFMEQLATLDSTELVWEMAALSFSYEGHDLVPGGSTIPVTLANSLEFKHKLEQYKMEQFTQQCAAVRKGLGFVVPVQLLSLFTWTEIEFMICGEQTINIDLLQDTCEYRGSYNKNSPPVKLFWRALRERFTEKDRELFLRFVWGRTRLPATKSECKREYHHLQIDNCSGGATAFPKSHSCFFRLDLPKVC
jgi:hypothetical protein